MRDIVAAAALVILLLMAAIGVSRPPAPGPALPACEEDAVILGTGAFDAGHWTAYRCGPSVDDLTRLVELLHPEGR